MQTTHSWPWQPFMFGSSILQDHHYDRGRFNIIDVVNRRLTAASTHTTDTMKGHVVLPELIPHCSVKDSPTTLRTASRVWLVFTLNAYGT